MNLTITAAIYFYFVFVGACYLLGFWIPLHFNILQFVSPLDILKTATYPIIPAALGILFYVLMDAFNSQGVKKPTGNDPKEVKVMFWISAVFILLLASISIYSMSNLIYQLFISEPDKRLSYALPVASFIGIFYMLYNPPFMKDGNKIIRNFLIIFVGILPTVAFFQGGKNINEIIAGEASYYKLAHESKFCKVNQASDMIYLGLYGNRYIFVDSISKDICIEVSGSMLLTYHQFNKIKSNDSSGVEVEKLKNGLPVEENIGKK